MKTNKQYIIVGMMLSFIVVAGLVGFVIAQEPVSITTEYTKTITTDLSPFIKDDFNPKYGVITLVSSKDGKMAEYSLTSTTESIVDIEMQGKATLYQDGTLFDDISFKSMTGDAVNLKQGLYYTLVIKDNFVDVPDTFKKQCEPTLDNKSEYCYNVTVTYKKENQPISTWEVYNKEIKVPGDYSWKFIGKRSIGQTVDVMPVKSGKEFKEWVQYNTSFLSYQTVTITGVIPANWTQEFTITKPSNMSSDCSDIRWVDLTNTTEIGHRNVVCNTTTMTEHVFLNNNNSIYLYYQNTSAVTTTSKWRNAYQCGDDFEDNTLVNISIATGAGTLSVANGVLNITHVSGGYDGWKCDNFVNAQNITIYAKTKSTQNGNEWYFQNNATGGGSGFDQNHASHFIHFYEGVSYAGHAGQTNQNSALSTGDAVNVWYQQKIVQNGTAYSINITDGATGLTQLSNGYWTRTSSNYGTRATQMVGALNSFDSTNKGSTDWYYVMPMQSAMPTASFSTESQNTLPIILNIIGKVVDSTGNIVSGATVLILNSTGTNIANTTSNTTGDWRYSFTNATIVNYTIIGYNPANISQGGNAYPFFNA